MTPTNSKLALARLHTLLQKSGNMSNKESILAGFGVKSSKELSVQQIDAICDVLEKQVKSQNDTPAAIRKARSTVLLLLGDLGIKGRNRNWKMVNDYLLQPRIAGKVLYEMDEQELKACAVRLRVVLKKKTERIEHENELAKNN